MFVFARRKPTWSITPPTLERTGSGWRVSSRVAGQEAWFESADLQLFPNPECFLGAFLIPALHHGATLRIDAPLDHAWLANGTKLTEVLSTWWGYPREQAIVAAGTTVGEASSTGATGLCFTAGIDSFHCLLSGSEPVDFLVFVHGFDVPLRDTTRMSALARNLEAVARTTAKPLVTVRTNLREHRLFRSVSWDRTHGGALAAVGHVLAPALSRLLIAASWPYPQVHAWGSHWMIDHLWSSSRLDVRPERTERTRWSKCALIGDHPLVRRHLHVCWKNAARTGNCSRCEKCLRTMLMLSCHGHLNDSEAFDGSKPLNDLLDRLPAIPVYNQAQWRRLADEALATPHRAAIQRLLARSPNAVCPKGSAIGRPARLFARFWPSRSA